MQRGRARRAGVGKVQALEQPIEIDVSGFTARAPVGGARLAAAATRQRVRDVLGAKQTLGEAAFEGGTQGVGTVALQQLVQLMDIAHPQTRAAVRELGEVLQGGPTERKQVFALEIAFGAPARHRGEELRAVLGQRRARARFELPRMLGFEAPGDDPHSLAVQVQRPGDADRLRRHRVGAPFVRDHRRGPDHDGKRSASSSGLILRGRSARASSAMRAAGGTPVAREGLCRFTSSCHSASCRRRSSSSRKRRCLKNDPFTQPTRFSTVPFCRGL